MDLPKLLTLPTFIITILTSNSNSNTSINYNININTRNSFQVTKTSRYAFRLFFGLWREIDTNVLSKTQGMIADYKQWPTAPFVGGIPHVMGGIFPRIALPNEHMEEPLYVNAKQFTRIMKRRSARAKQELDKPRNRVPFLHKSRHNHAKNRMRGDGGRFLTLAERKERELEEAQAHNHPQSHPHPHPHSHSHSHSHLQSNLQSVGAQQPVLQQLQPLQAQPELITTPPLHSQLASSTIQPSSPVRQTQQSSTPPVDNVLHLHSQHTLHQHHNRAEDIHNEAFDYITTKEEDDHQQEHQHQHQHQHQQHQHQHQLQQEQNGHELAHHVDIHEDNVEVDPLQHHRHLHHLHHELGPDEPDHVAQ